MATTWTCRERNGRLINTSTLSVRDVLCIHGHLLISRCSPKAILQPLFDLDPNFSLCRSVDGLGLAGQSLIMGLLFCRGYEDFQSLMGWPNHTKSDFGGLAPLRNLTCAEGLYPIGWGARSSCFELTDFRVCSSLFCKFLKIENQVYNHQLLAMCQFLIICMFLLHVMHAHSMLSKIVINLNLR